MKKILEKFLSLKGWQKTIVIIIIIGIIGAIIKPKYNKIEAQVESANKEGLCNMAYIISKAAVKEKLLSPKNADFPWNATKCTQLTDGSYSIASYVDTKNAFNADVRVKYLCILRFMGGSTANNRDWKIISIYTE